jgi:hypothetical protein
MPRSKKSKSPSRRNKSKSPARRRKSKSRSPRRSPQVYRATRSRQQARRSRASPAMYPRSQPEYSYEEKPDDSDMFKLKAGLATGVALLAKLVFDKYEAKQVDKYKEEVEKNTEKTWTAEAYKNMVKAVMPALSFGYIFGPRLVYAFSPRYGVMLYGWKQYTEEKLGGRLILDAAQLAQNAEDFKKEILDKRARFNPMNLGSTEGRQKMWYGK